MGINKESIKQLKLHRLTKEQFEALGEKLSNEIYIFKLGTEEYTKLATEEYIQKAIEDKTVGIYRFKGSVNTYADLEEKEPTAEAGDVWNVRDTGKNYAWTEDGEWDDIGGSFDLFATWEALYALQDEVESGLEELDSKINSAKEELTQSISDTAQALTEEFESGLEAKQDVLVSGENISTINGQSLLTGQDIVITSYNGFNPDWRTNNLNNFLLDIFQDEAAISGMAYYGELSGSGLPSGMSNGEVTVEIMTSKVDDGKVIKLTLTNSNLPPYHWEYTAWKYNPNSSPKYSNSGWIAYQPELEAGDNVILSHDTETKKTTISAQVPEGVYTQSNLIAGENVSFDIESGESGEEVTKINIEVPETVNVDGTTITQDPITKKITAQGTVLHTESEDGIKFDWEGTKDEYDELVRTNQIHDNWYYHITDDLSPAESVDVLRFTILTQDQYDALPESKKLNGAYAIKMED